MEGSEEIKQLILRWLDNAGQKQNMLAQKLGISAASLNQMVHGTRDVDIPMSRFLQIVFILHPSQADVDYAFSIYLKDLDIPVESLKLVVTDKNVIKDDDIRTRIHKLVDMIPEEKLPVLEPILTLMTDKKEK